MSYLLFFENLNIDQVCVMCSAMVIICEYLYRINNFKIKIQKTYEDFLFLKVLTFVR